MRKILEKKRLEQFKVLSKSLTKSMFLRMNEDYLKNREQPQNPIEQRPAVSELG